MATTTLIPLHAGKGSSTFSSLVRSINYVENPNKTDNGEWVTAYECDPLTVAEEFMFSKHEYALKTGRDYGNRDVIAYHLRQSFKPGETDAETANKISYDLAMSLTKGRYAFVCCTHTDKNHTHSHVIINSVSLEADRKFRNFKNSSFAIRKISDRLCLENGLSIIEKPKPSRGSYGKWLGDEKAPSNRKRLEQIIDSVLCECKDFDAFISALISAGCDVKYGKNLAIKIPGAKKNIRLDSLGENYTESAILERLSGTRIVVPKEKITTPTSTGNEPQLLIDIQSKIQEGKGGGYLQWSKLFNLKQAAKTLMFLQEQGIDSYEELCEKSSSVSAEFSKKNMRIREIEVRLKDISELQKQIGVYGKTRDNYKAYINSGKDESLYNVYATDIILHTAAKKYFDGLGLKKLPKMVDLKKEYATLATEKKKLYSGYHELKQKSRDLSTAQRNAAVLLGEPPETKKHHGINVR